MNSQLEKALDTTDLIAEINYLAAQINGCSLPELSQDDAIKDVSMHFESEIYRESGMDVSASGLSSNSRCVPSDVMLECYRELEEWQQQNVNDELIERLASAKPKKKKRKKRLQGFKSNIKEPCESCIEVDSNGKVVVDGDFHEQWKNMIKKDIKKASRQRSSVRKEILAGLKRVAKECAKVCRQKAIASNKCVNDALSQERKLVCETGMARKNPENNEKVSTMKLVHPVVEKKQNNLEIFQAKPYHIKLDYLLIQIELYAHYMSKKMCHNSDKLENKERDILNKLNEVCENNGTIKDRYMDKEKALENVRLVIENQTKQVNLFYASSDNALPIDKESLFRGQLKLHQEHGRQWLLYLFKQGINGILADEMGLGKTVQTIAFLITLAEKYDFWGPFLIIVPASAVDNWNQELAKFVPCFKVVPYWGNIAQRKILRRFWDSKGNGKTNNEDIGVLRRDSSYHIVLTSYPVVIQDVKTIGQVKWQYLVLDEALAIKNTGNQRWNTLLAFDCRNRLLLTGKPAQNIMLESWALLHFIMPTLFNSHDECKEWFCKDIESQAVASAGSATISSSNSTAKSSQQLLKKFANTRLTATQLERLHSILQPFTLKRIKAEVEHEFPKKVEKLVYCQLSSRQSILYERFKRRIRIDDLSLGNVQNPNSYFKSTIHTRQQRPLLNLLMQLRKVCNHPDLVNPRQEIFSIHTRFLPDYYDCPRIIHAWNTERRFDIAKSHRFNINSPSYIWALFKKTWDPVNDGTSNQMSLLWLFKLKYWWEPSVINIAKNNATIDKYEHDIWCGPKPIMAAPMKLSVHKSRGRIDDVLVELREFIPCWTNGLGKCVKLVTQSLRISDSFKLAQLDVLLRQLKKEGHRVLIYSQMTCMNDLIEELLRWRRLRFSRLDESSRLWARNDMVAEFQRQSKGEDIFAFLLSTCAGGLKLNLTAADTVIFYDSDWNPAVDEKAIDRVHQLGQDKPVTVYRLVCEATVEKQILARAEEKRYMQRMVVKDMATASTNNSRENSNSNYLMINEESADLKAGDVVSLLLADDEVRARFQDKQKFGGVKINNNVSASSSFGDQQKNEVGIKEGSSSVLGGSANRCLDIYNNLASVSSRKRKSSVDVATWQSVDKTKRGRLSGSSVDHK